jgi:hypothetical protein
MPYFGWLVKQDDLRLRNQATAKRKNLLLRRAGQLICRGARGCTPRGHVHLANGYLMLLPNFSTSDEDPCPLDADVSASLTALSSLDLSLLDAVCERKNPDPESVGGSTSASFFRSLVPVTIN